MPRRFHFQPNWAPEIVKIADTYFMYYSASQFGKNQSFIGVATSKNIEGPWLDQGEVFKTKQGVDEPNAIDANITFDRYGHPWMVYGSFFGGIYLTKINPKNGKLLNYGKGKLIAKRHHNVEAAIEGPYIIYNPEFDYFYLFVSYDSLFSNYNIRVARSKTIDGPYLDFHGQEMTDTSLPPNDVGLKILGGYTFNDGEGWVAPGHNSVLKDGEDYYVVHHMRAEKNKKYHYLHIRKVVWTQAGWPLVSPERFAGEKQRTIKSEEILGEWTYLFVDKDQNEQNVARYLTITPEGENWKRLTNEQFLLSIDDRNQWVECTIMPAWDWARKKETTVFMGMDPNGQVFIGKKAK
ncbi:arabinan endo-1,5-alpha-L-arabinosidase [Lederbergia galactosidilyticus]|nr:arabinan endo-1,5-alpha-L-arabinosidase [Lederbergia galactosidilytica]